MDTLNKYPDIWIDGVSASSLGIRLQGPLQLDPLTPKVDVISVPGRNGDVVQTDNTFANRAGRVSAFVYQPEFVQTQFAEVYRWLFSSMGYRKVVSSGDPEHYLMGRITNAGEIVDRLNRLAPFTIEFDFAPLRYLNASNTTVESDEYRTEFCNFTPFDLYPVYKVYYQNPLAAWQDKGQPTDTVLDFGLVSIYHDDGTYMGALSVTLRVSDRPNSDPDGHYFMYDSFTQQVTCDDQLNGKSLSFYPPSGGLKLKPGGHRIYFKGNVPFGDNEDATLQSYFTKIEITPRWAEI